jgi:hypothetical protein
MIEQNSRKSLRSVSISEALWAAYDQVAKEMGTDRDSLITQALFLFARNNGFAGQASAAAPATGANPAVAPVKMPRPAPAPIPQPEPDFEDPAPEPEHEDAHAEEPEPDPEPEPEPEPVAPPSRRPPPPVLASGVRRGEDDAPAPRRGAPPSEGANRFDANQPLDDDPKRREVAERVLETAAELERLIKGPKEAARPAPASLVNSDATNNGAQPGEKLLYLTSDDGELLKVSKERFLIGRGKHCDFVINSGKVSREHAAVVRDGDEFFIEDLGSSNGTWFNKQRIKRRKIEDGDEYFVCSEKLRCLFR